MRSTNLICTLAVHIITGLALLSLVGCASRIDKKIPKNLQTMDEIYDGKNQKTRTEKMRRREAEIQLRPLSPNEDVSDLPPAMLHVKSLYPKLPNPEVFMYVKPHPVGQSGAVVPGYYTRFHMYERDHYALPQESLGSIEPELQAHEAEEAEKREKAKRNAASGKR